MQSWKWKISLIINTILSLLLCGTFIVFTVDDILNAGSSYVWLICYSCPFLLAFLLIGFSQHLIPNLSSRWKYLPRIINTFTIVVGICLFVFSNAYPDFGFHQNFDDYASSVDLIERGQLPIYSKNFARLPDDFRRRSEPGVVYVTKEAGILTVYFMDASEIDGWSWGYLYRSDGSKPPKIDDYEEGCKTWREIKPPNPNWFYCINHSIFKFQ